MIACDLPTSATQMLAVRLMNEHNMKETSPDPIGYMQIKIDVMAHSLVQSVVEAIEKARK